VAVLSKGIAESNCESRKNFKNVIDFRLTERETSQQVSDRACPGVANIRRYATGLSEPDSMIDDHVRLPLAAFFAICPK
jgi:hypothetical protein